MGAMGEGQPLSVRRMASPADDLACTVHAGGNGEFSYRRLGASPIPHAQRPQETVPNPPGALPCAAAMPVSP